MTTAFTLALLSKFINTILKRNTVSQQSIFVSYFTIRYCILQFNILKKSTLNKTGSKILIKLPQFTTSNCLLLNFTMFCKTKHFYDDIMLMVLNTYKTEYCRILLFCG